MIAILTNNVARAVDTINRRGDLESFSLATRRGTFKSMREFVVITDERQLEGVRLTDYSVIGEVGRRLIDVARARMVG
jgi:hypothetical protein